MKILFRKLFLLIEFSYKYKFGRPHNGYNLYISLTSNPPICKIEGVKSINYNTRLKIT